MRNQFVLLVILFVCSSCSIFFKNKSALHLDAKSSHSNFIVTEVAGKVLATKLNGLPEEIKISYTACFRESFQTDNPIPDTLFQVHLFESAKDKKIPQAKENVPSVKANLKSQNDLKKDSTCKEGTNFVFSDPNKHSCLEIRTDASGCLTWTEFYPYKAMDESVWFGYQRAFEGTGVYQGVTMIPMATNPLLSIEPGGGGAALAVADLRYHKEYTHRNFIRLEKKYIPACSICASSKKAQPVNTDACYSCEAKQNSLSSVMNHFYQKASRPRLWLNEIDVNIRQELFSLTKPTEDQKKILDTFKVCRNSSNTNCEDPPGRFLKVHLEMPLSIRVKDHTGELKLLPLSHGQYAIKPYIFLQNLKGQEYWSLHRDLQFVSTEITQGSNKTTVRADFYIHVPFENFGLPAYFGLKIKAQDTMENIFLPFEGVFEFPDNLNSVVGSHHLNLDHKTIQFYKGQVTNMTQTDSSLIDTYRLSMNPRENQNRKGFRSASWDIELRRLRFSDISIENKKCPTPIGRHIRYIGEICIVDPLTRQPIPNTSLVIKREDIVFNHALQAHEGPMTTLQTVNALDETTFDIEGSRENVNGEATPIKEYSTDARGCLRWMDTLHHTWYNREQYFIRKMIFSIPELGFEGEKMIAINPWHWGFIFFQDITQLGPNVVRAMPERAERPRLILHDFRSMFVNPVYTINRLLNISLFQNLLFLFYARVDDPANVSNGLGSARPSAIPLRRGYYWLRFILAKAHTEELGGQGNMTVKQEKYIQNTYRRSTDQVWNEHIQAWEINRDGEQIGQMVNTNIEYITHFDTYVQVRDGMVNAYINFLFDLDQFIFIGSNNRVIVQMMPTDPSYYVYQENSCEVDPTRSQFVPFKNHDFITQPFMGTFTPGDRRNWNIFKPLSENMNSMLANIVRDYSSKVWQVNMDHTDAFIQRGKQHSHEHQMFLKLGSKLIFQTQHHAEKSRLATKAVTDDLQSFYYNMTEFLQLNSLIGKDHLIESIHQLQSTISTSVTGTVDSLTSFFLKEIQNIAQNLLHQLDKNVDKVILSQAIQQARSNIQKLIQEQMLASVPVSDIAPESTKPSAMEEDWSYHALTESYKKPKTKGFQQATYLNEYFKASGPQLSQLNMKHFAKTNGLKVIASDDNSMSRFMNDLNHLNQKYNKYYRPMVYTSTVSPFNRFIAEDMIELRQASAQKLEYQQQIEAEKNWQTQFEKYQTALWNNFPLSEEDDYLSLAKKTQQMYLPDFSNSWMQTVLKQGIHANSMDTPETMTFLHSMCFFWFEKFYDEYLEQSQLNTVYENHLKLYDYYRGTLEYLRKNKSAQQHQQLLQMMQAYSLMESSVHTVQKENPFFAYHFKNQKSNVLDSIQESIHHILPWVDTGKTDPIEREPLSVLNVVESLYMQAWDTYKYHAPALYLSGRRDNLLSQVYADKGRHPFFKCMANPFNFFHLENKIIVGDTGDDYSDLKYEYGQTRHLNIQDSNDWAYGANWSMARGFSSSIGTGVSIFGGLGDLIPTKIVDAMLSFNGIRLASDWNTSRSDSESARRQKSLRTANTIYLTVNHSVFSIRLKDFRRCLVIRPKNLSFEGYDSSDKVWKEKWQNNFMQQMLFVKSGLMLCSDNIHLEDSSPPEYILEDYFYIYQQSPGDPGQFQNPLNFRNRPYVITIRGVTELEKLVFLLESRIEPDEKSGVEDYDPEDLITNLFHRAPEVASSMREAFQQAKAWDKTGFYPGVYNVKYDNQHHYFSSPSFDKKSGLESMGHWLYKNNPLDMIRFTDENATLNQVPRQ